MASALVMWSSLKLFTGSESPVRSLGGAWGGACHPKIKQGARSLSVHVLSPSPQMNRARPVTYRLLTVSYSAQRLTAHSSRCQPTTPPGGGPINALAACVRVGV